ncbi:MAG: mitochondrial fission ELM1 family protein [Methylophilales bacterium]|nr:mitochondrial fission ELM1 family protein [Methylophilales bacterium]
MKSDQIIIWRITDGRKGHDIQSLSLTNAIQKIINCKIIHLSVRQAWLTIIKYLIGLDKSGEPSLIIGAGHQTHLPVLIAKFLIGGKSLLILKPTLPTYLFNLCLIPYHDDLKIMNQNNVIRFHGSLNGNENFKRQKDKKGLILIGGKSRHFEWDDNFIANQILRITQESPSVKYVLSNSPRTPKDFNNLINTLGIPNLKIIDHNKVPSNWIADRLLESKKVWVTNDSVSMIYESLSSGSEVGIIKLREINDNKVFRSVNILIEKNILRTIDKEADKKIKIRFGEAARCANLVKNKFFNIVND